MRLRNLFLFCILCGSLLGCNSSTEVASGLDAQHALKIIVTLSKSGVPAERQRTGGGSEEKYRVLVDGPQTAHALELIHEFNLLERKDHEIEKAFATNSFVPLTPELSKLRTDYARALQVEKMLTAFPGVVEASVLLRSSSLQRNLTAAENAPATAIVSLRYLSQSSAVPFSEAEVLAAVNKALPEVSKENIKVQVAPVGLGHAERPAGSYTQLRPFTFKILEPDKQKAGVQVIAILLLFLLAGFALGAWWGGARIRKKLQKRAKRTQVSEGPYLEAGYSGLHQTSARLPATKSSGKGG